jgi:hypothetical protein
MVKITKLYLRLTQGVTMKSSLITNLVGILFLAQLSISAHAATTARTWVSGVGNDANTASLCSRAAPCATFATAQTVTSVGGEINCVDPGGFGAVTITQSISIICTAGEAGVIVSGANGITIIAASNAVVYLSGLDIESLSGGFNGVEISSALRVTIQNCVIRGFFDGVMTEHSSSMTLEIKDTTVTNNANNGVEIESLGGTTYASIDHSLIGNNANNGVFAYSSVGAVLLGISDGSMSLNGGNGLLVQSGPGNAKVNVIRDSFVTNGGFGIQADQHLGGNASAIVGSSMFADDLGGAIGLVAGGTVYSLGNNQLSHTTRPMRSHILVSHMYRSNRHLLAMINES